MTGESLPRQSGTRVRFSTSAGDYIVVREPLGHVVAEVAETQTGLVHLTYTDGDPVVLAADHIQRLEEEPDA